MAFSYPRFNGETDATSHIRIFLNVWNANHLVQRISDAEAHASKIAEFGLTLDGRATCWHSQMDLAAITTFDQLQSAFLRFFHRRVPQREIIGQFYTIKQLPTESIVDFSLRFQSLRRNLTRAPTDEEAKETFLAALRRPLRTMLNMHNVKGETTEDSTGAVETDTIDNIRTDTVLTKLQRMTVVKSHHKNTVNNPGITGDSGITGTNKQYRRKLIHPRKWREASPAYTVSCVNNSVITQRNAHVEKERRQS